MLHRHLMIPGALALAQVAGSATAATVEEITVTATKREAAITDVAITMDAVGTEDLRSNNIKTPQDVAFLVPNVDIKGTSQGQANPAITIRGVGQNNFNSNNNGSAGVYLNEVFLSSPGLMSLAMLDVERVEVLKGPQGTLYGRNASAGALNLVSVKARQEFDGFATASLGDYKTKRFEGAVGGGISETMSVRVSGLFDEQGESFHKNRLTGDDFGKSKNYAFRGQVAHEGTRLDANFTLGYQKQDVVNNPLTNFGLFDGAFSFSPCGAAAAGGLDNSQCVDVQGYQNTNSDPFSHDFDPNRADELRSDADVVNTSLRLDYDISESLLLTSISGFVDQERFYGENTWATPLEYIAATHDEDLRQFSQELRLTGETGIANWIAGVYYGRDTINAINQFNTEDLLGDNGFAVSNTVDWDYRQKTENYAVFGSIDWALSDAFTIVTGLRYTDEEIDFEGATVVTDLDLIADSTAATCSNTSPKCVFKDDNTDWRLALEWRPSDNLLGYVSASTGFKSGGFNGDFSLGGFLNGDPPGVGGGYQPYKSEKLTVYEVGAKSTLADGNVQLNGAVFYYDYQDYQTLGPSDFGFNLTNLDKAELSGLDLDIAARVTDRWDVRAGLGYVDTKIKDPRVASDAKLPNAPEWQATAGTSYVVPVSADWALSLRADLKYVDDVPRTLTEGLDVGSGILRNPGFSVTKSYTLVNARVGLIQPEGNWEVSAYATNLTDEEYFVEAFDVFDPIGAVGKLAGSPRQLGLTATYTFD